MMAADGQSIPKYLPEYSKQPPSDLMVGMTVDLAVAAPESLK